MSFENEYIVKNTVESEVIDSTKNTTKKREKKAVKETKSTKNESPQSIAKFRNRWDSKKATVIFVIVLSFCFWVDILNYSLTIVWL